MPQQELGRAEIRGGQRIACGVAEGVQADGFSAPVVLLDPGLCDQQVEPARDVARGQLAARAARQQRRIRPLPAAERVQSRASPVDGRAVLRVERDRPAAAGLGVLGPHPEDGAGPVVVPAARQNGLAPADARPHQDPQQRKLGDRTRPPAVLLRRGGQQLLDLLGRRPAAWPGLPASADGGQAHPGQRRALEHVLLDAPAQRGLEGRDVLAHGRRGHPGVELGPHPGRDLGRVQVGDVLQAAAVALGAVGQVAQQRFEPAAGARVMGGHQVGRLRSQVGLEHGAQGRPAGGALDQACEGLGELVGVDGHEFGWGWGQEADRTGGVHMARASSGAMRQRLPTREAGRTPLVIHLCTALTLTPSMAATWRGVRVGGAMVCMASGSYAILTPASVRAEILPRVPVAGISPCPDDDHAMAPTMPGPVADAPETQRTEAQAMGERLRYAREAAGIDASLAGEHIVRSAATIWSYERANNAPSLFALRVLAKLYGVSLEWLQTGEGPGPGSPPTSGAAAVAEAAPAYPAPPPEPPGYSIRRPLAPGQPRRYRLVCPVCGKPWIPEDLGRHLVTGDGCNQPHSMSEAEALIAGAKRDIKPWLEELERLDLMLEDLRRRRDSTKDKTARKVFSMSIELVEIQREKIIHCGPEKYEWHDE